MQSIQIAEWFGMAAICLVSALTTVKILTGGSRQPRNAPLAGLLPPQPSVRSAVHPPNAPCDDDTDERADLSDIVVHAPYPIWKTDVNGRVIWGNMVYLDMVPAFRGADPDTDRPLFPVPADHASGRRSYRAGLHRAGATTPEWFDVTIVETGEISLFYAQDVNAVVSAEATQREFIQTLSKTFAQLSTGLAIFDREKTLLLFNPALIDLFA